MASIPDFIADHRTELLELCVQKLRRHHPDRSDAELEGSLPLYLEQLIEALREGTAPMNDPETESGRQTASMGEQRLRAGFEIASIPQMFGVISDSLGELGNRDGVSFPAGQYRVFNACIDASIATAIETYVQGMRHGEENRAAQFVGTLAHELRNELWASRIAYTNLRTGAVGIGSKTSDVLGRSLGRMESLITQTLAAVHLEAGKAVGLRRMSLAEVVEDLQAATFPERQVRVRLELERPREVLADERLLASAIGNLLQNALKYTRAGGEVVVRAFREADEFVVEVEDECGGLAPGSGAELFTPFVQKATNRTGLGLGLTITKQAVEAQGGSVRVRNLPGKGCVFVIRQPAGCSSERSDVMSSEQPSSMPNPSTGTRQVEKPTEVKDAAPEDDQSPHWDVVDEASWESFPASDPPAYVRGVSKERKHDAPKKG